MKTKLLSTVLCFLFISAYIYCQGQWNTTVQFAGLIWDVKSGKSGPGPSVPNNWSDSPQNVWVDGNGQLHLKIRKVGNIYYCSEIRAQQSFGYGEYRFYVASRVDTLDPNIVAGMFTYETDLKEIDIEFHRFDGPSSGNGNYTVQPTTPQSHHDFELNLDGDYSTHKFIWSTENIKFQSYHGHYESLPNSSFLIHDWWPYTGSYNPPVGNERLHINFFLFNALDPINGQDAELIIKCVFVPPVGVTSPNGGEIWTGGHIHDITWNLPTITGNVKIELVRDNSYSTIAYNLPNSGLWQWLPISQNIENGDNYKIQVSSINNPSAFDISDGNFTIVQAPELISPVSGSIVQNPILLDWTTVLGATGYDLFIDGSLKTTTSQSEYTITLNEGTHYWQVRSVSPDGYSIFSDEWSFVVNQQNIPSINVSQNSLPDFGTLITGNCSSSNQYTVSGIYLNGNISITPPSGFKISTNNINFSTSPITLTQTGGTVPNTTIYVEFCPSIVGSYSGNITHTSSGATTKNVAVIGTGINACVPVITISTNNLNFGNIAAGTTSPNLQFNVSGSNMISEITVTAPVNFEISLGGTWGSQRTLQNINGSVPLQPVYVRFNPPGIGTFSGDITLTSTNATTQIVHVTGIGTTPPPGTSVCGDILTSVTWTLANSPYTVCSSGLYVANGATLTINPGVVVKFQPGSYITIVGTLHVDGTGNKVTFVSTTPGNTWDYIVINSQNHHNQCYIKFADFINGGLQINGNEQIIGCTFKGCNLNNNNSELVLIDASYGGNASFTDCVFENNTYDNTVYIDNMGYTNQVTFTNCIFQNNQNTQDAQGIIELDDNTSPVFNNCDFFNNSCNLSNSDGGVFELRSGASPIFNDCQFINNHSEGNGGVMLIFNNQVKFRRCLFEGNSAAKGGVIYSYSNQETQFESCKFINNSGTTQGGILYTTGGSTWFINCLTDNNNSPNGKIGYISAPVKFTNSIILETQTLFTNHPGYVNCYFSIVPNGSGSYMGNGTSTANPMLNANYYPQNGSPCIEQGTQNTNYLPTGFTFAASDFGGNQRIQGNIIDIGIYEAIYIAPSADFISSPTIGIVPLTVNFTDLSTPGSLPIASWSWDFGDGGISTLQNPQHLYLTVGYYTVSLTVTNQHGSDTETKDYYIQVTQPIQPPVNQTLQNIIIANSQNNCYNATQTINVAGNGTIFVVQDGGSATMIAGQNILYLPGTTVQSGGYMWGYIVPNGPYCLTPSMPKVAPTEDKTLISIEQSSFKIYPNPTIGAFILELKEGFPADKVTVTVYGMRGEKVLTEVINGNRKHELSLSNSPAGIYFIRVITGDKAETAKIIKL